MSYHALCHSLGKVFAFGLHQAEATSVNGSWSLWIRRFNMFKYTSAFSRCARARVDHRQTDLTGQSGSRQFKCVLLILV